MKNLLVAVDFSKSTEAVLEEASKLAAKLSAKLWVLHVAAEDNAGVALQLQTSQFADYSPEVVTMPGDVQLARDISAEELKREHSELLGISSQLRKSGIDGQALLVQGNPAVMIIEKARELHSDMIILGSHGHSLLHKALLGSVSEAIIRHAGCNVLIVPSIKG